MNSKHITLSQSLKKYCEQLVCSGIMVACYFPGRCSKLHVSAMPTTEQQSTRHKELPSSLIDHYFHSLSIRIARPRNAAVLFYKQPPLCGHIHTQTQLTRSTHIVRNCNFLLLHSGNKYDSTQEIETHLNFKLFKMLLS